MENMSRRKRARVNSDESESNSPEVKRLREDLLNDLNEESEFCTMSRDFDSFMKSFEEEITTSPSPATTVTETEVVELMADSDESLPDLGYLLEASDDELGLPPPSTAVETEAEIELIHVSSDSIELCSELWELEERIPNYDSFELGITDLVDYNESVCEYVAIDGLFDHSDLWRPETLPAQ